MVGPIHSQRDGQLVGLRSDGRYWPANFGSDLGHHVVLGAARLWTDQHAKGRWMADTRRKAQQSTD
jgi:hypothetical protein